MRHASIPAFATATAAALVPLWAWAQGQSYPYNCGYGPHMMGWGGGWFGMIFGSLVMILVLGAAIAVVILLVRRVAGPSQGAAPPARTPLDILKERFARGELDKLEFEERRRLLGD
jgi:putative membrane protein